MDVTRRRGPGLGLGLLMLLAGCATPGALPPDAGDAGAAVPGVDMESLAWTALTDGPTPRTEVVVGLLGSKIHVIGGFPLPPVPVQLPTTVPVTTVEVYDVASGAWSTAPDYPLQIHHAQAVELDGRLCIFGGQMGPAFLATPLSFCLAEGAPAWTPIAPMPGPRGTYAAAVLDGIAYVAGGAGPEGHVADVWAYDPAGDSWSVVGDPIPTTRGHTSGAAVGGLFCVVAGDVGGHGDNTNATECFDPASGAWSEHAPVPTLRGSISTAVWRDRLLVLGGQNATQTFANVEAFDLANDTWIALPPLAQARHGFGAVTYEDVVYAAYGGPEPGLTVTGSVEALSASTSS